MAECFIAEVIQAGRITIPEGVRDVLGLTQGDRVRVTVEKIVKAEA